MSKRQVRSENRWRVNEMSKSRNILLNIKLCGKEPLKIYFFNLFKLNFINFKFIYLNFSLIYLIFVTI